MNKTDFLKYINDDCNIIEAGANKGYDTVHLSQVFKNGIIYAVEPINHHYKELKERTKGLTNVRLFNLALHSENGESEMFVSSGNTIGSDTLLQPKEHLTIHPDIHFNEKQKVKTIKLDDFVKENNINGDIACWFDMEGNEFNVLSVAEETLKQIKLIYMEYSIVERYEGLCLYEEFKKFLVSKGFKEIFNETTYNYLGMGNAAFIKEG
jgi:FkbM family methyltransferase